MDGIYVDGLVEILNRSYELLRQHKKLENQLQTLIRRAGSVSEDVWKYVEREMSETQAAMKEIAATVETLEAPAESSALSVQALDPIFEYSKRVRANLATFGFEEKRLVLEALRARVEGQGREWTLSVQVPLAGYVPTIC